MDETPMWFDLPSNTTINQKGAKTVSIRTTGHERSSFTVILACMADGTKLPAVCIFKLKNIPKENFPHGIYIRANEKGWVNEQEMLWWVENVWTSRNRFGNPRSMLVLDSFRGHIVNSVKNRFVEKNTNIAVIPGGCTSKLQLLDVAINKSFKSKVKDRYNNWMISNTHTFTPAGKIKRPSYSTVATWVKESWDEVDENLIQRSFKSCGVLTNIDSSEDDCIFDHDSLLNRDNEVLENFDNSTDENYEEEYPEETNYENKWDVKVVVEVGREEDNDKSESEKEEDDVYGEKMDVEFGSMSNLISQAKFTQDNESIELYPGMVQFYFEHVLQLPTIAEQDDNRSVNIELWKLNEFYEMSRDSIIPIHNIYSRFIPTNFTIRTNNNNNNSRRKAKTYMAVVPINRKFHL
ncbi:pogo transposable element with KRAB domain [Rhizophagus irregularis DAOM 181602=DAOM 197198]|nr:pogo transposable element with KRAB domain [Rhizophagus irregularis DAOM 181602=DAOM 197198]